MDGYNSEIEVMQIDILKLSNFTTTLDSDVDKLNNKVDKL